MEEKVKTKKGIIVGIISLVCILVLVVVGLAGYIIYDNLKDSNETETEKVEKIDNSKNESKDTEIEYVYDESKIFNKDNIYSYTVVDEKNDFGYVKMSNNGVILNDSSNDISAEITRKYKSYLETVIFKGGPDMYSYRALFLTDDGYIEYLKYDVFEDDGNGNIGYGFRLYRVNNLKDVVKFYVVKLDSDGELSPSGQTVLAQTKDGTLYDLFDYVFSDTKLIGSYK